MYSMQSRDQKSNSIKQEVDAPSKAAQDTGAARLPVWTNALRNEVPAGLLARKSGANLQAKLAISQPDDPQEREADRLAEEVMRMPDASVHVQRQATSTTSGRSAPPIVKEVLKSGNSKPLEPATRHFMDSRFGYNFDQVRIHTDTQANESAQAVNAQAYTVGSDIVFNAGQYQPGTGGGQHLLAHELAHVVQQSHTPSADQSGKTSSYVQRQAVPGQKSVSSMSTEEKLGEAISRSLKYMGPELGERIKELLTPQSLAIIAVTTAAFIGSQVTPIGWLADILAGLALGVSIFFLGKELFAIADHLVAFMRLSINATSENDLEEAGHHFAIVVTKLGVDIVMAILLHKAGKAVKSAAKAGSEGGGSGGEGMPPENKGGSATDEGSQADTDEESGEEENDQDKGKQSNATDKPGVGKIPDAKTLSRAGMMPDKQGYTRAGRAFQKHGSRNPGKWGAPKGNPEAVNVEGQRILDEITNSPDTQWTARHHARFGDIVEGKLPDGRGARWSGDGNTFHGFIE